MHRIATIWRTWLFAWLGMVVLALANGTLRALVVQPHFGEEAARQVATGLLLLVLTVYVWWLQGRYPIPEARTSWGVGVVWVAMTLVFEFGFGRLVEGLSWSTMFADYNLTEGRLWVLVPFWTAMLPAATRAWRGRSQQRGNAAGRRIPHTRRSIGTRDRRSTWAELRATVARHALSARSSGPRPEVRSTILRKPQLRR